MTKQQEESAARWSRALKGVVADENVEWYEPIVVIGRGLLIGDHSRIDSFVKLEVGEGMKIGRHVHIASFCHLGIGGGKLTLEDGSSCGSGVKIVTGSNVPGRGHGCSAVAPDAVFERKEVRICKNATLFVGAIVLPGVTVGEEAVVAAGAVVRCDVPAGELWGGVPARRIRPAHLRRDASPDPTVSVSAPAVQFDMSHWLDSMAALYEWPEGSPV